MCTDDIGQAGGEKIVEGCSLRRAGEVAVAVVVRVPHVEIGWGNIEIGGHDHIGVGFDFLADDGC